MLAPRPATDGYRRGLRRRRARRRRQGRAGSWPRPRRALADRVAAMAAALDDAQQAGAGAKPSSSPPRIARKLAAQPRRREPTAEIEALVAECLASLDGVPHLVIRCDPELADAVRDIAEARMTTSGFTGRLVVMGDPEIALGDGRIEWADGGLVRDSAAISRRNRRAHRRLPRRPRHQTSAEGERQ